MFVLIDNFDSFTYNLVQAFQVLGHRPLVVRNNDTKLLRLATSPELRMVCISPGPESLRGRTLPGVPEPFAAHNPVAWCVSRSSDFGLTCRCGRCRR